MADDEADKPYEFLSRTGDGVFVVDDEQRIVLWNDAASGLLGFRPADALGRRCYQMLGGTDAAGCAVCRGDCLALRAARRGEPLPARDVLVRTRDGERILLNFSTIAFPASWRELSVLAHLFRGAGARADGMPAFAPAAGVDPSTLESPPVAGPSVPIDGLTRREHEVLHLLSTGASTERICDGLGIARATTRAHVRSILSKLGVGSRLEAVTFGVRAGVIEIARADDRSPGATA